MNQTTPPPVVSADYGRIKMVTCFEELLSTPFEGNLNALCWKRTLPGDFGEVVANLGAGSGITTIEEDRLKELSLSNEGKLARDILLADQELLRTQELSPVLDCVNGYHHDMEAGAVPTHVQSFHADSATVVADTYLCTYYGLSSEGVFNEEAIRRVDIPETRALLLEQYGGLDDDGFLEYLNDNYYDLHYVPLPEAQPYSFGVGNLWRIAIEYPDCAVPPCIHRAPATLPGQNPRLLLIS
jgi:hypothetical protein